MFAGEFVRLRSVRFRTAAFALLATVGLAACDGGGTGSPADVAYQPREPDESPLLCADTPAQEPRTGYPVYEVSVPHTPDDTLPPALVCDIAAHYEAGYVIVAEQDIDPWNDTDPAFLTEASPDTETVQPPQEHDYLLHQTPINPPVYAPDATGYRETFLFARHPDGNGEPWECEVVSGKAGEAGRGQEHAHGVAACLADLRQLAQADPRPSILADNTLPATDIVATTIGSPSLKRAATPPADASLDDAIALADAAVASSDHGSAMPDTRQWTLLGSATKKIQHSHPIRNIALPPHRGDVQATFDVYRLNSLGSQDYYLVRTRWSMTPNFRTPDGCNPVRLCGHYNNQHRLRFSLQRQHAGKGPVNGVLAAYSPQNVVRAQTVNSKIGGGLSVAGQSGEASASAEISTSYTYRSASIQATEGNDTSIAFDISHATNIVWWGVWLYDKDPTTISTMAPTVWALYSFPRHADDALANTQMVLNVQEMTGSFGYLPAVTLPVGNTSSYRTCATRNCDRAFTARFSLPHFSVRVRNDQGKYVAPPSSATNPLALKRGQVQSLLIDAGGVSDADGKMSGRWPIALNWQLIDLPSSFSASDTQGNRQSRIEVVVKADAKVGETGFLKFNTTPRAAAPGLQSGNVSIPYVIVE